MTLKFPFSKACFTMFQCCRYEKHWKFLAVIGLLLLLLRKISSKLALNGLTSNSCKRKDGLFSKIWIKICDTLNNSQDKSVKINEIMDTNFENFSTPINVTEMIQLDRRELKGFPLTIYGNSTNQINSVLNLSSSSNHSQQSLVNTASSVVPLYSVIFLLAVIGNSLVILTLVQNKRMRTITNLFLLNLAVSDLFLGVFCMPFTLVGMLLRDFIFGEIMCKLLPYLQGLWSLFLDFLLNIF